jgi:hypothetical protein
MYSFPNASANCLLPKFRSRKKMQTSGCWGVANCFFNLRHRQPVVGSYAFDPFSGIEASNNHFGHYASSIYNRSAGRNSGIYDNDSGWIGCQISRPVHPYGEKFDWPALVIAFYSTKVKIQDWAQTELSPARDIYCVFLSCRPLDLLEDKSCGHSLLLYE